MHLLREVEKFRQDPAVGTFLFMPIMSQGDKRQNFYGTVGLQRLDSAETPLATHASCSIFERGESRDLKRLREC